VTSRQRHIRVFVVSAVVATVIVLGATFQDYYEYGMRQGHDVRFMDMLMWPLVLWYAWAFLAPFVFEWSWRHPVRSHRFAGPIGMLLLGQILAVSAHITVQVVGMQVPQFAGIHDSFLDTILDHTTASVLLNSLVYWCLAIAAQWARMYADAQQNLLNAARLEAELASVRLEILKTQLHPHFLFNALNSISTLMHQDVALADRMLSRLSMLVRTALERSGRSEVRLREEVKFLEEYVALERLRFGDGLKIEMDIQEGIDMCLVPGFLFQPLVENAIKHGFSGGSRGGTVRIMGRSLDGTLQLRVEDNGQGPSESDGGMSTGVGLANLHERLSRLYGAAFTMDAGPGTGGGFFVDMVLPCRMPSPVQVGP